jgi:hypothetical protein
MAAKGKARKKKAKVKSRGRKFKQVLQRPRSPDSLKRANRVGDIDSVAVEIQPLWLLGPAEPNEVAPPVTPSVQVLPFSEISWREFERLCLRVSRNDGDAEYWALYGRQGQDQSGIDIYVRLKNGAYALWQAKRHRSFSAVALKRAIATFLKGRWANKCQKLVLAMQASIQDAPLQDEVERQAKILRDKGIILEVLGGEELSERLKQQPELVFDFFGLAWTERFCGQAAIRDVRERLSAPEVAALRAFLRNLYQAHFGRVDPGAFVATTDSAAALSQVSIEKRFVPPDLYSTASLAAGEPTTEDFDAEAQLRAFLGPESLSRGRPGELGGQRRTTSIPNRDIRQRVPAFKWIADNQRSVILGGPGSGKSTVLRMIALDLLSDHPMIEPLAKRWGTFLPLWLPFPFWTRRIQTDEPAAGLIQAVKDWISLLSSRQEVLPIIDRALRDNRVLLLLDGLDEWANESAARTAVNLLNSFVETRELPAVISSRPLGYQRIGPVGESWRTARLASFTKEQQIELVERWLASSDSFATIDRIKRASELVERMHRHPSIARLAEIPLLLWGFVSIGLIQAQLPSNRVAAYRALCDLLLKAHPARRKEAALDGSANEIPLSEDVYEKVLAKLALSIQREVPEGVIDRTRALSMLDRILRTELDLPQELALSVASRIMSPAAEASGVFVEAAPSSFRFLHRSLQEFLAARDLATNDLSEQLRVVRRYSKNPEWRDVFLCLLYLNQRGADNDQLVTEIRRTCSSITDKTEALLLLGEAAFGTCNMSQELRRDIADHTFALIERGTFLATRLDALEIALDGLNSDWLRPLVIRKLDEWYPDRLGFGASTYREISEWDATTDSADVLMAGLFNEEDYNQREAAQALAKRFGGDEGVLSRLLDIVTAPHDSTVIAYAFEAIVRGWPSSKAVEKLIAEGFEDRPTELQLIYIFARVLRGEHDEVLLERLLRIAKEDRFTSTALIAEILLKGWPHSEELKKRCLKNFGRHQYFPEQIPSDIAAKVLIRGYPQDDDVAAAIAEGFAEKYPDHSFRNDWQGVISGFQGHPLIAGAVESWLERETDTLLDGEQAALLARTEKAKNWLITHLHDDSGMGPYWTAWALLEGWGITDPAVSTALARLLESDAKTLSLVGEYVPDIAGDPRHARSLLLTVLRSPVEDIRIDFVVRGLRKVGVTHADKEVMDIIFQRELPDVPLYRDVSIRAIVEAFPEDARTREMAIAALESEDYLIASVAKAYKNDAEMRERVRARMGALPSAERLMIVERLAARAVVDGYAKNALAKWHLDEEAVVRTLAAIKYFADVPPKLRDETKNVVVRELFAIGPRLDMRRQAAFAAAISADLLKEIVTSTSNQKEIGAHAFWHRENPPLLECIAKKWDMLKEAFQGDSIWARLGWGSTEAPKFEALAPYINERDGLFRDLENFAELQEKTWGVHSEIILALARITPGSDLLRRLCLKLVLISDDRHIVGASPWDVAAAQVAAGQVLASQFTHSTDVYAVLEQATQRSEYRVTSGLAIALADGWPASSAFDAMYAAAQSNNAPHLLLPASLRLACLKVSAAKLGQRLHDFCALPVATSGISCKHAAGLFYVGYQEMTSCAMLCTDGLHRKMTTIGRRAAVHRHYFSQLAMSMKAYVSGPRAR